MNEQLIKLSVYGILVDTQGHILLQKRANTSYAEGWWSLPGGHVESGESITAAVQRELFEELNIETSRESCSFCLTLIRKPQQVKRYVNFFYVIQHWSGEPVISDNKASKLSFYSRTDLPDCTLPYIKEALHLIDKGVPFHESAY